MVNSSSKAIVTMALCLAAILAIQGLESYKILEEKSMAQETATEAVQRWRQNYMALGESVARWNTTYRRESEVQDLLSLFSIANLAKYGLWANSDTMILYKIDSVAQNNAPIGLIRICLASSGSGDASALEVQAENYQTLFRGIKKLADRPDIHIGTISIRGDKLIPIANLGDFCVLLSKD